MSKACIIFLLVILSCQNKKAEYSFETMNEGELVNKHFYFSLPYQNTSDSAAVITVMINGKPRRFMVDTGAPLAISGSLQKELNYPILLSAALKDSNGDSTKTEIVRVSELSLGELKFKNIPALVLDFDQPLFACDSIAGLIGSNLLRLLVIQFNKPEQRVYFADHIDSLKLAGNSTVIAMQLNASQSDPVIPLGLNGIVVDSTLYDSGDKTLYTVSKSQFDKFNYNQQFNRKIIATGIGVGTQGIVAKNTDTLSTFICQIDSLSIGQKNLISVYSEPNYSSRSRMGRGLWDYGLVTMDYPQSKFYFTPSGNLNVLPPSQFGFRYQERNGKLLVTVVWNNTKAFSCGLKPGFEIIQFGNFKPTSFSKCAWASYVEKEVQGTNLTIKYRNEKGKVKQCTLNKTKFNFTK